MNMKVNRPIPWIGMPIAAYGTWQLVSGNSGGVAQTPYYGLHSYVNEDDTAFCLPGEPNAMPMSGEFIGELLSAYDLGPNFALRDGVWVSAGITGAHLALPLPKGTDVNLIFPNNGSSPAQIQNLKKLNTDGRRDCAQCGKALKALWIGSINLSHCLDCEG
jgi:hypothetical protein